MVAWVPALAPELVVSARVLAPEWAVLASVLEWAPELAELAPRGAWVSAEARQELAQVRVLQELVGQARELVSVPAAQVLGASAPAGLALSALALVPREPRAFQIMALAMQTTALDWQASILPTSAQPSRHWRSQSSSGCCGAVQLS
ncbi:hypothetical protein ACM43_26150 [Bradyrhizobium sp. CCBAU 45321]|nr:hypothetical protein [Bradyrhizobium sp. CCBAU 45321]